MKAIMQHYFESYLLKWSDWNGTHPQIPFDAEIDQRLYIGEKDEDGYIFWKPREKDEYDDFQEFEKELNATLHSDIKEYYNSYWFLEMIGWIDNYNISLFPVTPGIESFLFIERVQDYLFLRQGDEIYIPIGFESSGMLILMNNRTGEIVIEDFETEEYRHLSVSLKGLISRLSFR
ncbi:SecY-interacting protein Syd [Bacillus cereus]|uniref:SecY-interacting protein Syd n=1 Tax=Bacillus cereus TaxID=1396 RepID=UPI00398030EB